jgi:predicted nucleic acid-binding protein
LRFWDTSAVVPLVLEESATSLAGPLLVEDEAMVVWWGTRVECVSAVSRRVREGVLDAESEAAARAGLDALSEGWSEMQPTARLRTLAERLLARHPLRAADALQLAAALRWCEEETVGREMVCLDERLRGAAEEVGFTVLPAAPGEQRNLTS